MFDAQRAAAEAKREQEIAVLNLLADLRYPVSKDGSVLDTTFFAPLLARHLTLCGYRLDLEHRKIKSRRVSVRGVPADAVEWVDVSEPDDPLADLHHMTMADIDKLSPVLRAEALRRMGAPEPAAPPPANPGWHVQTHMTVNDHDWTEDE